MFGRKPGNIEFALIERMPVFADELGGQGLSREAGLLAGQNETSIAGIELPQLARFRADFQHVAGMDSAATSEWFGAGFGRPGLWRSLALGTAAWSCCQQRCSQAHRNTHHQTIDDPRGLCAANGL